MYDNLLFIIFPYTAAVLAIVVSAYRLTRGYTYSSLSSQFLEGRELFYGSVPWHYGIIAVLTGHIIGFLVPARVLAFNAVPWRLYLLESSALAFGLLCLVGIVVLIVRRATSARIRAVTTPLDAAILLLLLTQVATGVFIAIFYRWGSSWYAYSAAPYLRSLFALEPDIKLIAPLPFIFKLHMFNAFVLLAVFPFSRLLHALAVPVHYLWRPYQVVIWARDRGRARNAARPPRGVPAAAPAGERPRASKPVFQR